MYHRILFAHDGSDRYRVAFPHLLAMAQATGAEIVLAHVVETRGSTIVVPDSRDAADAATPAAEGVTYNERLETLRAELGESGLEQVETVVAEGDPGPTLARLAEERACDLVILATRARSGVSRALMGSVADHMVRNTPGAAVLLVRASD